jgi:flagellar protein FliS
MAIEQKNIMEANQYIQKSQAIVFEFMATLDMEYEVSANMMSLYRFINEHLLKANIRKDANLLQEAIELLETMRDTWNDALKLTRTQKVAGSN